MDLSIFEQTFDFLAYTIKVFSLKNTVHFEAVLNHVLNQILSRISVITDSQRVDVILLDHHSEPVEAVMIIDEVVPAGFQKPALDHQLIGHAVPFRGFVDLLARQPELSEDIELAVLLDHDDGSREVAGLRQVDASDRIALAEVVQVQRIAGCKADHFGRQPGERGVLLDVAVFGYKLRLL